MNLDKNTKHNTGRQITLRPFGHCNAPQRAWWLLVAFPLTFLSLYLKVCGETAVLILVLANFQNSTLKRRLAVYVY